jgi:RNA polymerase sigma-70 factor (ECF subfamily)
MVFATAVRLLGNASEAEDVAQTVFLKAFQRFDAIGSSPTAPGWLKTTTRNACLNHLSRYRARWRFFSELDGGTSERRSVDRLVGRDVNPALEMEQAERNERLEEALRRLPDHQRVPLVLFHFEELGYQEIASTLGVSLGKVKTDIHRGREALKALLTSDRGAGLSGPREAL